MGIPAPEVDQPAKPERLAYCTVVSGVRLQRAASRVRLAGERPVEYTEEQRDRDKGRESLPRMQGKPIDPGWYLQFQIVAISEVLARDY
jgi:hypothetical protein